MRRGNGNAVRMKIQKERGGRLRNRRIKAFIMAVVLLVLSLPLEVLADDITYAEALEMATQYVYEYTEAMVKDIVEKTGKTAEEARNYIKHGLNFTAEEVAEVIRNSLGAELVRLEYDYLQQLGKLGYDLLYNLTEALKDWFGEGEQRYLFGAGNYRLVGGLTETEFKQQYGNFCNTYIDFYKARGYLGIYVVYLKYVREAGPEKYVYITDVVPITVSSPRYWISAPYTQWPFTNKTNTKGFFKTDMDTFRMLENAEPGRIYFDWFGVFNSGWVSLDFEEKIYVIFDDDIVGYTYNQPHVLHYLYNPSGGTPPPTTPTPTPTPPGGASVTPTKTPTPGSNVTPGGTYPSRIPTPVMPTWTPVGGGEEYDTGGLFDGLFDFLGWIGNLISGFFDFIGGILEFIGGLLQSLLNLIGGLIQSLLDGLLALLKSLFIPSEGFMGTAFDGVKGQLESKITSEQYTSVIADMETIADGSYDGKLFEAETFAIMGMDIDFNIGTVLNDYVPMLRSIITALVSIMLIAGNYKKVIFLIRGNAPETE